MRFFKIISAVSCALLFLVSRPAQAHTVGFEFEDYVHAWPTNVPPHATRLVYPTGESPHPKISVRYDDRKGYKDLEIHLGPFDTANVPATPFANYSGFYGVVNAAAAHAAPATLAGWYDYRTVTTFRANETDYALGYVTHFIRAGIPNKTQPANPPISDVGAQATFSLGAREVYAFFKAAATDGRFPYFRPETIARVRDRFNPVDADFPTVEHCLHEAPQDRTIYACSLRARGFGYFLAEYLSNTVAALNASRFNGTEIRKESYPLLLRNVGADVNGVKEYFDKIVHDDPEISGNRAEYVRELKAIERRMVIDMNANGDGMTKNGLIDAYVDFLAGRERTNFLYGPQVYGAPKYTFTTLGAAQDAVIQNPLDDEIYLEARSVRTITTATTAYDVDTYAIPSASAVQAAQAILTYLTNFHAQTGY